MNKKILLLSIILILISSFVYSDEILINHTWDSGSEGLSIFRNIDGSTDNPYFDNAVIRLGDGDDDTGADFTNIYNGSFVMKVNYTFEVTTKIDNSAGSGYYRTYIIFYNNFAQVTAFSGFVCEIQADVDKLSINQRYSDSTWLGANTTNYAFDSNTWYKLKFNLTNSSGYWRGNCYAYDMNDNLLASITNYGGNNIASTVNLGYGFQSNFHYQYMDNMTITNRTPQTPENITYLNLTSSTYWDSSNIENFSVKIDYNGFITGYANMSTYDSSLNVSCGGYANGLCGNGYIQTLFRYNVTNGLCDIAGTSINCLVNLTYWTNEGFNGSIIGLNISEGNYDIQIKQSQVNVSVFDLFTNETINNITITVNGTSINTTSYYGVFYPDKANGYSVTFVDNTGQETYHITSNTFNVSLFDNKTEIVYGHPHEIFVYARTKANATISNFTAYLVNLNISDNRSLSTTTGVVNFDASHYTYNISVNASGYSLYNNSGIVTFEGALTQNQTIYIYLYTTNSINFTFYDESSPTVLLNTTNITFSLINGGANNYSTSTGFYWITLLSPTDYEIRYSALNYDDRSYYFSVTDQSTQFISLYLSQTNLTEQYLILVKEQSSDAVVTGATVRLQQQFIELNGTYTTVEECTTNDEGKCDMYIQESSNIVYRFIVIVDGEIVKTTEPTNIFTPSGVTKQITIRVDLGQNVLEVLENNLGVAGQITFSGNVSTFTFVDTANAITQGCQRVKRRYLNSLAYSTLTTSCSSGTSGTININFQPYILNETELLFEGYVLYTSSTKMIDSQIKSYPVAQGYTPNENDNLFLLALLFLFVSFATLIIPSLAIQLLINFGALIGIYFIGFTQIGVPLIMLFLVLALIINWDRKSTRGQP